MSTFTNYAILILMVSALVFIRVFFDMRRARNMALEALTALNQEFGQAKLEVSRVTATADQKVLENHLQFLAETGAKVNELMALRDSLLALEKEMSFMQGRSDVEHKWLSLSNQAKLHRELVKSNARSFKLQLRA